MVDQEVEKISKDEVERALKRVKCIKAGGPAGGSASERWQ